MRTDTAYGQLQVELDDIMVPAEHVEAARVRVCAEARDVDEAAVFLAMLGIGSEPAWNMGAS